MKKKKSAVFILKPSGDISIIDEHDCKCVEITKRLDEYTYAPEVSCRVLNRDTYKYDFKNNDETYDYVLKEFDLTTEQHTVLKDVL